MLQPILSKQGKVLFGVSELHCKCDRCATTKAGKIPESAAEALRKLREDWSKPLVLNSACRCKAHNADIGGHPRSLHVYDNPVWPTGGCIAFDVSTANMNEYDRRHFVTLAWETGWSVGLAKTFVHIDRRTDIGLKKAQYKYADYDGELYTHLK